MSNLDLTITEIMHGDTQVLKIMKGNVKKWPLSAYTVTTNLTNITSDAPATALEESSLTINLTPNTGHYIDNNSVVVTMGEDDITNDVYSNGVIIIASVTGNVSITAVTMFDAQVEYLQSSGSQYINLGIVPASTDRVILKFQLTASTNGIFFGSRYSSTRQKFTIGKGSDGKIFAALGSNTNVALLNYDTSEHEIIMNASTGRASIDGGSSVSVGTFVSNSLNMGLFGCNTNGTFAYTAKVKIMKLTIENRMDLIPVRKNGVGYMFDKLSGNLLGAATGTFTYGNDV